MHFRSHFHVHFRYHFRGHCRRCRTVAREDPHGRWQFQCEPDAPPLPPFSPVRRTLPLGMSSEEALPVLPGPKSKALPGARPTGAGKLADAPPAGGRYLFIPELCPAGEVPYGDPLRSDPLPILSAPTLGKF